MTRIDLAATSSHREDQRLRPTDYGAGRSSGKRRTVVQVAELGLRSVEDYHKQDR
jgi:hypothetical protein